MTEEEWKWALEPMRRHMMREATQEEREGIDQYIDSIAKDVPGNNIGECEDCISRQAAIDLADKLKDHLPDDERISDMVMSHNEGILDYQTQLSLLPSVTPKQKTGHWTHDGSHWKNRFICSECGYKLFDEQTNYCPHCGAKMQEVGE